MADLRLRALVVDDDAFARRLMSASLVEADIAVVAEAHDGSEALRLCVEHRPDVVVMDIVMPNVDGITATREITAKLPQQLVVILTGADETELAMLALRAGAVGVLNKEVDPAALPRALRAAMRGEAAISRQLSMRVIEQLRSTAGVPVGVRPVASPLTAREWEVLDLLYEGSSTDQIARALVISRETVRSHVKHILRKLGVNSREEAMAAVQRLRSYERDTAPWVGPVVSSGRQT
jgi:DNA-binding NarL/FixJ family response regulator